MNYLRREKYLSRIRPFIHDEGLIKVLTGVRRCGKSTVLEQIRDEILSEGVTKENVIHLNLDRKLYRKIKTADQLEQAIDSLMPDTDEKKYLFIDEVQNVDGFEELINAYREDGVSVFITGSNSYLLSGEMVTKLTGRYVEFKILTFTLSEIREYMEINGIEFDSVKGFNDYLRFGGYPKRFDYYDADSSMLYVRSVIEESVSKDILMKKKVRNRTTLEKVMRYLFSSPSATISSTSIADYMKKEHTKVQYQTVLRYLDLIASSKLACKCERYDIIGKKTMKTLYKSYVADPAIHSLYPGDRQNIRLGAMIENIVYNELISRGYDVYVGKFKKMEVDFVVKNDARLAYVQVAYLMPDEKTINREKRPLISIRDAFPKYIITMDPITVDMDGIRVLNLVNDFLLGDKFTI